jgi:phosphoheptose isomerase
MIEMQAMEGANTPLDQGLAIKQADSPELSCQQAMRTTFAEHGRVMAEAGVLLPVVLERIAEAMYQCFASGHKVLACGNGGSAADSGHLVAELVGRYCGERRSLPAIGLVDGPATMSAIANDYGYERVFARQVEGLAQPGDLLFAISTSGRSKNVVAAAQAARERGCRVAAFTGRTGEPLATFADWLVAAPSDVTARIQEVHSLCIHLLCESLDARLAAEAHP